jgi:hypothetical protein
MAILEAEYLTKMWERNMCPYCRGAVAKEKRVGSGRKSDGGFCSLQCYASYHALDLAERARLLKGVPPIK